MGAPVVWPPSPLSLWSTDCLLHQRFPGRRQWEPMCSVYRHTENNCPATETSHKGTRSGASLSRTWKELFLRTTHTHTFPSLLQFLPEHFSSDLLEGELPDSSINLVLTVHHLLLPLLRPLLMTLNPLQGVSFFLPRLSGAEHVVDTRFNFTWCPKEAKQLSFTPKSKRVISYVFCPNRQCQPRDYMWSFPKQKQVRF